MNTIRTNWQRKSLHNWFIKVIVKPMCSNFRWSQIVFNLNTTPDEIAGSSGQGDYVRRHGQTNPEPCARTQDRPSGVEGFGLRQTLPYTQQVPAGKVTTYGEMAKQLDSSPRAVGQVGAARLCRGLRVYGLRFTVYGLRFTVYGLGFRV